MYNFIISVFRSKFVWILVVITLTFFYNVINGPVFIILCAIILFMLILSHRQVQVEEKNQDKK